MNINNSFGPEQIQAYQEAQDRWDVLFDKMTRYCKQMAPKLGLNTHYVKSIVLALFKEPLLMVKGIPPEDLEALKSVIFPDFDSQPWTEKELKSVFQLSKKSHKQMAELIQSHFSKQIALTLHKVNAKIPDEVFQNERELIQSKALEYILKNLKTYQVNHQAKAQFWTYIQPHLLKQLTVDAYALQTQAPQKLQKHIPLLLKLRHLDPDLIAEIMSLKTQQKWSLEKVNSLLMILQHQKQTLSLDAPMFNDQGDAHELIAQSNATPPDETFERISFMDKLQEFLSPEAFQSIQQKLALLDSETGLDHAIEEQQKQRLKDSAELMHWLDEQI